MGPYIFRKQPLKSAYLAYQLASTLFVRIPFWILLAIPRQVEGVLARDNELA